ncbi:Zinc finger protein [Aphelenchoides fujianensis]|nr:Zinc finger protein [Aphelenchoides fujianensis]
MERAEILDLDAAERPWADGRGDEGGRELSVPPEAPSYDDEESSMDVSEPADRQPPSPQSTAGGETDGRKRYERFREKKFVCDECDRMFTLKQNVQTHLMRYHMGSPPTRLRKVRKFECEQCDESFRTKTQLEKHTKRAHREPTPKIKRSYACPQCEKVYGTTTLLEEHVSVSHLYVCQRKQLRPYKCEVCDARFGRKGGLRRHILIVHGDLKYKCPALAAHIRSVHTKERPFVCGTCSKRFIRRNDLKMHEGTHDENAGQQCAHCGRHFKRDLYLKKHLRICPERPGSSSKRKVGKGAKKPKKEAKVEESSEDGEDDQAYRPPSPLVDRPRRAAAAHLYARPTVDFTDELPEIQMPIAD